jgi:peptide deformylase
MAKLPIITVPDPILRRVSEPVDRVDGSLQQLIDDMLETMYAAPGVGLAAVQVGVPRRLMVLDVADHETDGHQPLVLINPEILSLGEERRVYEEGCLSIPDLRVDIERPAKVRVRYLDRDGSLQERNAEDLFATVVQHEIDHLDGKLIIDFLSPLKRDIVVRKLKKLAKSDSPA